MGDNFLDLEEPGTGSGSDDKDKKEKDGEQLILGRFKTADDLAKSYKELEAKFTQDSQEKSELKKQLDELQKKVTSQPQPEPKQEEPVDLDALFWDKPSKMLEVLKQEIQQTIAPLYSNTIETQKTQLRNDPDFKKYEQEIDQMMQALPSQVRNQPGVIGELFNLVKGRHQGEILEEYKKKIREELEAEREGLVYGSLEAPSGGEVFTGKDGLPRLSEEEKRVAEQFNPDMTKAEAHRKYAERKLRVEKLDRERMRR